jgi:hypothetical protein
VNPTRQRLATSRKRVLRGPIPQGRLRSVDSEAEGRVNEPRKAHCRWGRPRIVKGRQHSCAAMAWHEEPDRGQRARHTATGVAPGTWEIPSSPPKKVPARVPADQRSRLAARGTPMPQERTRGRTGGTAGTRATESGRRGDGKSESSTVPRKLGNRPEGPGGGKGAPGHGTEWRERCRDRRISGASQRDFVG